MIITQLKLNNFKCYYGINEISFDKGLNLIIGDNGYGKSKIYDAFYWVLNDKCFDTDVEKFLPTDILGEKIISDKAKSEIENGVIKTSVTLELKNEKEDEKYVLERSYFCNKDGDIIRKAPKSSLKIEKISKFGVTYPITEQNEKVRIIEKILPSDIKPYMWFQGEEIENMIDFNNQDSLTEAINILSDITKFDKISDYASKLNTTISEEYRRKAKSLSKDEDRSRVLNSKIDEKNKELDKTNKDLEDATFNYNEAERKLERVINHREDALIIQNESEKLSQLFDKIQEHNEEHDKLQVNFNRQIFKDHWLVKNTQSLFEEFSTKYSKYINDRLAKKVELQAEKIADERIKNMQIRLPINVPAPLYVQKMLDQERCLVCDRDAKKGTKEYESIKKLLGDETHKIEIENEISNFNLTQFFEKLYNNGLIIKDKSENIDKNIDEYLSAIDRSKDSENELLAKQKDIERKLDDLMKESKLSPDIAKNTLNEIYYHKIESKRYSEQKYKLETKKTDLVRSIEELDKQLENLVTGEIPEDLIKQKNLAEAIQTISKSTRERVFLDLLMKLEKEANNHYLKMTRDNKSFLGIIKFFEKNGNYLPGFVDEDGNPIFDPNKGNKKLAKFAIIMAIISARKVRPANNLYTLISDAPTAVFGEDYTLGLCSGISNVYSQSIVMSYEFFKNEKLREQLLNDPNTKLGKVYMITSNLTDGHRSDRNKLETRIEELV